jgi:hypothetical protein
MTLRPCAHCSYRGDCEIKRTILARVRGLTPQLSLIGFRCPVKWELWPVGARVWADVRLLKNESGEHFGEVHGTLVGYRADRATVWLDEPIDDDLEKDPRWRIKLHQDRLHALDEPARRVCPECGRPDGAVNSAVWHCDTCERDAVEGPLREWPMDSWTDAC